MEEFLMNEIILADHGTVFAPVWVKDTGNGELYAARELVHFLSEITGTAYPLIQAEQEGENGIVVARSSDPSLGKEGFTISTQTGRVFILGGLPRGILYGVYSFLERLGCRWFSSKVSHIPKHPLLTVPAMDVREVPVLEYRDINAVDATDASFAVRNKYNGNCAKIMPVQGGKITYHPFVHTFNSLVPAEKYFDTHPEYFSLVNGKRLREGTQLCLTNPDVKRLCVEGVEQWIREHPEATIFSVSQNDNYNACDCDDCKKLNDEEGARSGSLIHFVNHIAEAIEQTHPHVVIDTLAYQWSRSAPKKVRPRRNVCVRLCSIECCFSHPLRTCDVMGSFTDREHGDSFQKDLQDWAKVCGRLYIWDYVVNFTHFVMPYPNFHVLADNIRFFIENNVKGIFEEAATSMYGGTEFAELRAYVLGKLLWDPSLDTDTLAAEFFTGYYRMAADPIREYFHLIHDAAAKNANNHFGIYDPPRILYLTPEVVKQSFRLFAKALALADDEEVLRRVRIASMPLRYWEVYAMPLDNPERPAKVELFFADLAELGINEISENRSIRESREKMKEGITWYFKNPN
jgi:hypothetical protein